MAEKALLRLFLSAADLTDAKIVRLPHPRTEQPTSIALAGATLLEIQRFADKSEVPHSWLLAGAERVLQTGELFIATPLDPLFLLLPRLKALRGAVSDETRGYFRPLSDVAGDGDDAAAMEITALAIPDIMRRLRAVCDVNDKYDEPMIRLNDARLMSWLQRKVDAVQRLLAADAEQMRDSKQREADAHTSQFDVEEAAPASTGGESQSESSTHAEARTLALGLVSEYLAPGLQSALCAACATCEAEIVAQRGLDKKRGGAGGAPAGEAAGGGFSGPSSWAADLAEAEADAENRGPAASAAPPPAKKAKTAPAPAKSKASALPLKKGQLTMGSFFKK